MLRATPEKPSNGGGSGGGSGSEAPSPGLGLKAVWVGAEAFGNLVGATKGGKQQQKGGGSGGSGGQALSRPQAIAAIREDYDQNYFVSGVGSMSAYAPDCLFADPFAGFNGTDRFRRNVSNLGGLMSDIQLDITGWQEGEQDLTTKWRFSAILDLPWRPRLAAAGGTTHVFDQDTGLVVKHIESWDVEPGRVVRQLLKPSAKVPGTMWEVLMISVHDGDVVGVWYALSSKVVKLALPASAALAVLHLARGEGLGALEGATYLGVVAGLVTELYKVVRSITGGESG